MDNREPREKYEHPAKKAAEIAIFTFAYSVYFAVTLSS